MDYKDNSHRGIYILAHPPVEMRSTKKATVAECATSVHLWRQILWICIYEARFAEKVACVAQYLPLEKRSLIGLTTV